MKTTTYSKGFYDNQSDGSLRSARVVVPLVMKMIDIESVVDVGCGIGTWLKAFQESGVPRVLGLDGDYVDRSQLLIPKEYFLATDLSREISVSERFDLAVCLEVAEHLPASRAKKLVAQLTSLSSVVLFSAAVPLQGGTRHINEQWPQYWQGLFEEHNFKTIDSIRRRIWQNAEVEPCYRQNIFLHVDSKFCSSVPLLNEETNNANDLLLIQKEIVDRHLNYISFRSLPNRIFNTLRRRTTWS